MLPVAFPPRVLLGIVLAVLPAASPSRSFVKGGAAGGDPPLTSAALYNSARFVTWPADVFTAPDAPLIVCVMGADPFGSDLDSFLADKTVSERRVLVRRGGDLSALAGCHLLFVAASEAPQLDRILEACGRGMLTVSDIPRFADRGGMIGFVVGRGRVRLEVNTRAAHGADLEVSSKLLKLARVIR